MVLRTLLALASLSLLLFLSMTDMRQAEPQQVQCPCCSIPCVLRSADDNGRAAWMGNYSCFECSNASMEGEGSCHLFGVKMFYCISCRQYFYNRKSLMKHHNAGCTTATPSEAHCVIDDDEYVAEDHPLVQDDEEMMEGGQTSECEEISDEERELLVARIQEEMEECSEHTKHARVMFMKVPSRSVRNQAAGIMATNATVQEECVSVTSGSLTHLDAAELHIKADSSRKGVDAIRGQRSKIDNEIMDMQRCAVRDGPSPLINENKYPSSASLMKSNVPQNIHLRDWRVKEELTMPETFVKFFNAGSAEAGVQQAFADVHKTNTDVMSGEVLEFQKKLFKVLSNQTNEQKADITSLINDAINLTKTSPDKDLFVPKDAKATRAKFGKEPGSLRSRVPRPTIVTKGEFATADPVQLAVMLRSVPNASEPLFKENESDLDGSQPSKTAQGRKCAESAGCCSVYEDPCAVASTTGGVLCLWTDGYTPQGFRQAGSKEAGILDINNEKVPLYTGGAKSDKTELQQFIAERLGTAEDGILGAHIPTQSTLAFSYATFGVVCDGPARRDETGTARGNGICSAIWNWCCNSVAAVTAMKPCNNCVAAWRRGEWGDPNCTCGGFDPTNVIWDCVDPTGQTKSMTGQLVSGEFYAQASQDVHSAIMTGHSKKLSEDYLRNHGINSKSIDAILTHSTRCKTALAKRAQAELDNDNDTIAECDKILAMGAYHHPYWNCSALSMHKFITPIGHNMNLNNSKTMWNDDIGQSMKGRGKGASFERAISVSMLAEIENTADLNLSPFETRRNDWPAASYGQFQQLDHWVITCAEGLASEGYVAPEGVPGNWSRPELNYYAVHHGIELTSTTRKNEKGKALKKLQAELLAEIMTDYPDRPLLSALGGTDEECAELVDSLHCVGAWACKESYTKEDIEHLDRHVKIHLALFSQFEEKHLPKRSNTKLPRLYSRTSKISLLNYAREAQTHGNKTKVLYDLDYEKELKQLKKFSTHGPWWIWFSARIW